MPKTTQALLDKYNTYAQTAVDEQAILDKYNAATAAAYEAQRAQNRTTENQFYNQMYNTQRTAMDTIRQSNAAAVSTGASRGVQAANELSALLGLQQESVAGATEIAQARQQTAQEETAAMLDNTLKAYQQAQTERANLIQSAIQADSINQQRETAMQSLYLQALADNRMAFAAQLEEEMREMGIAIPGATSNTNTNTNTNTSTNTNTNIITNTGINIDTTTNNALGVYIPAGLQVLKAEYDAGSETVRQQIRTDIKNGKYNQKEMKILSMELQEAYPRKNWHPSQLMKYLFDNYFN